MRREQAFRLMDMACLAMTWCKHPVERVGAALAAPDFRSFAVGYSGPVSGFDDEAWLAAPKEDRDAHAVHAELNAILNARRDLAGWSLATTKAPCFECAKAIVQAGIRTVVTFAPFEESSWLGSQLRAEKFLTHRGLDVVCLDQGRGCYRVVPFGVRGSVI